MDDNQNNRGRALAAPSTQSPNSSRKTNGTEPTTLADFGKAIAPVLTLVAPTGMTQDERKAWVRVAHDTLAHIPLDLLLRAEREVRTKVDHPAKIVKAIADAAAEDLAFRKRMATPVELHLPAPEPVAIEDKSTYSIDEVRHWTVDSLRAAHGFGWITDEVRDAVFAERGLA